MKKTAKELKGYFYAQISDKYICIGVSQLSDEIVCDKLIPIKNMQEDVIGKKWNGGAWIKVTSLAVGLTIPRESSNSELLQTINDLRAELEISGVIL